MAVLHGRIDENPIMIELISPDHLSHGVKVIPFGPSAVTLIASAHDDAHQLAAVGEIIRSRGPPSSWIVPHDWPG